MQSIARLLIGTIATTALAAVPVAPAVARGETATIVWSPCPEDPDADCGTLPVPLDWSRPHGPKIELAAARRRATDPSARIEPVRCSVEAVETYPRIFPTTREAFDRQVADNRRLRQDCRRHTGPVFHHADSLSGVYDMDATRAAVGDQS